MTQRTYDDPILELSNRLGDPINSIGLTADMTPQECELAIEALDEADAEEEAASYARRMRAMGYGL